MSDPIRARLDWLDDVTAAKHQHAMNRALRAVLDLCDEEHPEYWTGPMSNAVFDFEHRMLRTIAEALGVTDE